jgi:predicted DNA-binding transcriptional regulator AlpA
MAARSGPARPRACRAGRRRPGRTGGRDHYRRVIDLDQIERKTLIPKASLRYKRHLGELPFLFRLGRRLVAFDDEVDAWIVEQRKATSRTA